MLLSPLDPSPAILPSATLPSPERLRPDAFPTRILAPGPKPSKGIFLPSLDVIPTPAPLPIIMLEAVRVSIIPLPAPLPIPIFP